MFRLLVAVFLASTLAASLGAAGSSARSAGNTRGAQAGRTFRGPGGNVVCGYFSGAGLPALLECGVAAQLVPLPPRPSSKSCGGLDFAGNRLRLNAKGRSYGFCTGDEGVLAYLKGAPRLASGSTWHQGPYRCTVTTAWVKCTNTSGHGFSMSRTHWQAL